MIELKDDYRSMVDNAEGLKVKDTKTIGKYETGGEYLRSMHVFVSKCHGRPETVSFLAV